MHHNQHRIDKTTHANLKYHWVKVEQQSVEVVPENQQYQSYIIKKDESHRVNFENKIKWNETGKNWRKLKSFFHQIH